MLTKYMSQIKKNMGLSGSPLFLIKNKEINK